MSNTEDAFYGVTYYNSATYNTQIFKKDLQLNNIWSKNLQFYIDYLGKSQLKTI